MTRDALRSRTVRPSLVLLQEDLKTLRRYAADFDPDEIDRLVKSAELTSAVLKKLQAHIPEEPLNDMPPASGAEGGLIDVGALRTFLNAVEADRICATCGGLLPYGAAREP